MAGILSEALGADLFSTLTGGARTALPFIVSGVSQGLSANAISGLLQQGGMGINRQKLLTLVRTVRGNLGTAAIYNKLSAPEIPPSYIFTPSATFMRNPFAYVLRVTQRSTLTGLVGTRMITLSSPSALSNEQIADYAEDVFLQSESNYHAEYLTHTIEDVLVDPRYIP